MDVGVNLTPINTFNHSFSHQTNKCVKNTSCEPNELINQEKTQNSALDITGKLTGRKISHATCDDSLLIKINTSNTYQYRFKLPSSEIMELSLLRFSINENVFNNIDGNNRDIRVSESVKKYIGNGELKISINTGDYEININTLESELKSNFLRCINEGMLSFYTMPDYGDMIEPTTGKTYKELLGDDLEKPTCCQFTRFLKYSYTDFSQCPDSTFELSKIDGIDKLPSLAIIQIRYKRDFIHEFFHISNDTCLQKMGSSQIVFIKLDQILKHYRKHLKSEALYLVELVKRF